MPQPLPLLPCSARRGVTLLELLVVLTILGVASAVALPLLRVPGAPAADAADERAALVQAARRLAVARGEPVRLRLAADGVWAIVTARDGTLLRDGRIAGDSASDDVAGRGATVLDLGIDAMGSCIPVTVAAHTFDPVRCAARAGGDSAVSMPAARDAGQRGR